MRGIAFVRCQITTVSLLLGSVIDHEECPVWVIRADFGMSAACPVRVQARRLTCLRQYSSLVCMAIRAPHLVWITNHAARCIGIKSKPVASRFAFSGRRLQEILRRSASPNRAFIADCDPSRVKGVALPLSYAPSFEGPRL